MNGQYKTYPNARGCRASKGVRGSLRVGIVEDNKDTRADGLSGQFAAVTDESDGTVRFYILTTTPANSMFPNNRIWIGPYSALSEEISELVTNEAQ